MKFCTKCGAQLSDDVLFCTICGEACSNQNQKPAEEAPLSSNTVIDKLKELLSSKLVLAIAILLSCAVGFSMISGVKTLTDRKDNSFNNFFHDYSYQDDYEYYDDYYDDDFDDILDDYMNDDSSQPDLGFAISVPNIFLILITVSVWMIFAAASDRKFNGMKTAGFTFMKVSNLIWFILSMIIYGVVIALFCIMAVAGFTGGLNGIIYNIITQLMIEIPSLSYQMPSAADIGMASNIVGVISTVFTVLFIGLLIFQIFIFIKSQKTIVGLRETAQTGEPTHKVSPFIGVMCYIGGVFNGLSALSSIPFNGTLGLYYGCYGAALIIMGIMLFRLRREMHCFVPVEMPAEPVAEQIDRPAADAVSDQTEE